MTRVLLGAALLGLALAAGVLLGLQLADPLPLVRPGACLGTSTSTRAASAVAAVPPALARVVEAREDVRRPVVRRTPRQAARELGAVILPSVTSTAVVLTPTRAVDLAAELDTGRRAARALPVCLDALRTATVALALVEVDARRPWPDPPSPAGPRLGLELGTGARLGLLAGALVLGALAVSTDDPALRAGAAGLAGGVAAGAVLW